MQSLDWFVLILTLLFIVIYGTIKTTGAKTANAYLKAGNDAKWWTIGLSVMATQASAITFLSCLLYTSPSPRDATLSRMPSSA